VLHTDREKDDCISFLVDSRRNTDAKVISFASYLGEVLTQIFTSIRTDTNGYNER
jgi:hypothetical protein